MALDGALEPDLQARSLSAAHRPSDLCNLESSLGYTFIDRTKLILALTHVGATQNRLDSYQRLEFLGDRVLGLVVADMLHAAFPSAEEGELSRRLADLVRRESCAAVAIRWNVAPHLRLGAGEARNDTLRAAILGDACEAILGAVFLDGGYTAAAALVRQAFGAQMLAASGPSRDPKTTLQEWAQGRGLDTPVYRERARTGPAHAPEFTVAVVVRGHVEIEAKGTSKRLAEQAAAAAFMRREGLDGTKP